MLGYELGEYAVFSEPAKQFGKEIIPVCTARSDVWSRPSPTFGGIRLFQILAYTLGG